MSTFNLQKIRLKEKKKKRISSSLFSHLCSAHRRSFPYLTCRLQVKEREFAGYVLAKWLDFVHTSSALSNHVYSRSQNAIQWVMGPGERAKKALNPNCDNVLPSESLNPSPHPRFRYSYCAMGKAISVLGVCVTSGWTRSGRPGEQASGPRTRVASNAYRFCRSRLAVAVHRTQRMSRAFPFRRACDVTRKLVYF